MTTPLPVSTHYMELSQPMQTPVTLLWLLPSVTTGHIVRLHPLERLKMFESPARRHSIGSRSENWETMEAPLGLGAIVAVVVTGVEATKKAVSVKLELPFARNTALPINSVLATSISHVQRPTTEVYSRNGRPGTRCVQRGPRQGRSRSINWGVVLGVVRIVRIRCFSFIHSDFRCH